MTLQLSTAVRNGQLDAIEAVIGVSAFMQFYSGAQPANCAAGATGTLLAELPLPADWMNPASSGTKALLGAWSAVATATGTIGYFRLVDNAKAVCGAQGSVTATGGGGNVTVNNGAGTTDVTSGQTVTEVTFTLTGGNP